LRSDQKHLRFLAPAGEHLLVFIIPAPRYRFEPTHVGCYGVGG
jgi:hypothetical protein